jgi:hypothetical protein
MTTPAERRRAYQAIRAYRRGRRRLRAAVYVFAFTVALALMFAALKILMMQWSGQP